MNSKNLSLDAFLDLPDWKKINIKNKEQFYDSYPLMDDYTQESRIENLYIFCAHFQQKSVEEFISNRNQPLDFYWPPYFQDQLLTPRMFDVVPIEFFTEQMCVCATCRNFSGIRNQKVKKGVQLIPFKGRCKCHFFSEAFKKEEKWFFYDTDVLTDEEKRNIQKSQIRRPNEVCEFWHMRHTKKREFREKIKDYCVKNGYLLEDLSNDLKTVSFWRYFYDEYGIIKGSNYNNNDRYKIDEGNLWWWKGDSII